MSTWVSVITAGSFDAFVIGALVSAACFIAIVVSWRVYRREPADSDPETVAAGLDIIRDDGPARDPVAAGPDRFGDGAGVRGRVAAGEDTWPDGRVAAGPVSAAWGPEPGERVTTTPARGTWADEPPDREPWLTGPQEPASGKRQARAGSHRAARGFGDPTMADGMPKPPGARRTPRHAAPSPRLGGKKDGVSAAHSFADGSRG